MLSIEQVKQMSREKALELIANTCNYQQIPATREEFPELFEFFNISEDEFNDEFNHHCYFISVKGKESFPAEMELDNNYDSNSIF